MLDYCWMIVLSIFGPLTKLDYRSHSNFGKSSLGLTILRESRHTDTAAMSHCDVAAMSDCDVAAMSNCDVAAMLPWRL